MVPKSKRINGKQPLLIPNSGIRAGYGDQQKKTRNAAKRNRRHFISNIINDMKMITLKEKEINANKKKKASKCFICRKRGHLFRNCPSKNPSSNAQMVPTVEQGQNSDDTKYTPKYEDALHIKGDYLVKGTEHGDWNFVWFVSLSNSKHFTSNKNIFSEFKRCFGIETRENNSTFLFTHGVGEIELETNDRSYTIPCVYYIPETETNLLSMTQLVQQGFEVDIDGSTCTIRKMFEETYKEMSEDEIRKNQNDYLDDYFEILNTFTNGNGECKTTTEEEDNKTHDSTEISQDKFERFIHFMKIANKNMRSPEEFNTIFDENMKWFHHTYIEGGVENEIPPTIIGLEISTYDLYKLVKSYGGYDVITKNNEWEEIANSFGFPKEYDLKFKDIYLSILHIPNTYYEVASRTSSSIPNRVIMSMDVEPITSSGSKSQKGSQQDEVADTMDINSNQEEKKVEITSQNTPHVFQFKAETSMKIDMAEASIKMDTTNTQHSTQTRSNEELKTQDQEDYILID